MDCCKTVNFSHTHSAQDNFGHGAAVQHGEILRQFHIVDFVAEQFAADLGEDFRYRTDFELDLCFQPLDRIGDFTFSPLRFESGDYLGNLLFGVSAERPICFVLIEICDLCTDIPTAGVDDKILVAFITTVYFNEVVVSAESADASFGTFKIHFTGAAKFAQLYLRIKRMLCLADVAPGRYLPANKRVESGVIYFLFRKFDGFHAAANAYADHTWHNFV
jgi:hypothetical protein